MNVFTSRLLHVNLFMRRSSQYVAQVHAKIHSIIQKESSIELFQEILLKKYEVEKMPSDLLIYSHKIRR